MQVLLAEVPIVRGNHAEAFQKALFRALRHKDHEHQKHTRIMNSTADFKSGSSKLFSVVVALDPGRFHFAGALDLIFASQHGIV